MSPVARRADPYPSNAIHLRDELRRVAGLLRAQLLRFRDARPEAHRERFWHLSDEYLSLLAADDKHSPLKLFEPTEDVLALQYWAAERRAEIDARVQATSETDLRLVRLRREFGLSQMEADALLLAMLPSLHSRYREWFGILQHDPARTLLTVGLATETLSTSAEHAASLAELLGRASRLMAIPLLVPADTGEMPVATRVLALDERVSEYLLGSDVADARLSGVAQWFDEPVELRALPFATEIANRLELLPNLRAAEPQYLPRLRLKFTGPDPELTIRAVAAVASGLRRRLLVVRAHAPSADGVALLQLVDLALREARLGGGLPLFLGLDALRDSSDRPIRIEPILERIRALPHPVAIHLNSALGDGMANVGDWIPFAVSAPSVSAREKLWVSAIAARPNAVGDAAEVGAALARAFQLTYGQFLEAWRIAESLARQRNVFVARIETQDLYAACRQQSATKLVAFAQRLEPKRNLNLDRDLILAAPNKRLLTELRARIRNHARLQPTMRLGDHMRLGRGTTALFVGCSGSGKTWAAEVLASEQQLDLYRIDLAAVISKWLGETEQNLNRVFADAERANCMLFFDECDSLFGRRGEIKDARDRWANLEVNFLLQRIEEYSGTVILATNLREHIDEAFLRRIHVVVEFPMPDAASRLLIWERLMPSGAANGVAPADVVELSQRFTFTGGEIKNVVLDACFRALEEKEPRVTTRHLVAAAAREFQKAARPVTRGDFGRFFEWAVEDVVSPLPLPAAAGA